jgi:hypothetical protein
VILDLDGELLQVLVVLNIFVDSFADDLSALLAVLLLPRSIVLLVGRLRLLLCDS